MSRAAEMAAVGLALYMVSGCSRDDAVHPSDIRAVTVPLRDGDISIDGKLDDPAWKKAATTGKFVHPGTGKLEPRIVVQGSAKLLWDDTSFYIAFEISDRELTGGFPADAVDPHLWTKDCVEIMIDPEGDNRDYYEIQINPQNLVFDSRFDDYNQPRGGPQRPYGHEEWSSAIESAVTRNDAGYIVEARLAWQSLAKLTPPKAGDVWRMNFYALSFGGRTNGATAWSPILGKGNFHHASRFGRVRFER